MDPRETREGPAWDLRDPRRTRVAPRLMMACGVDPTKNFHLESRPPLSLLLDARGPAWTVDPHHTIGPHRPHERCLGPAQHHMKGPLGVGRVRPAEPAQGASNNSLTATQTTYTALEPAKDLPGRAWTHAVTRDASYRARPRLATQFGHSAF